ncbi:hypothetical protein [Mycoplasma todarodis]|uniref:hypothetical protein n=1 Tax=Mycoplasma todarodis TaxID=1937191 RepID=UPI003B38BB60
MNKSLKRVSIGALTALTFITPVIAISCGKKSALEKIQDEKKSLLKKFDETIKQERTITLKIDETKFNGSIQNNQQLIRYMLIPEYFTKKKTSFNSIIKNKEVLPHLIQYNKWTNSMSQVLKTFSDTEDAKGLINSTQTNLAEAAKRMLSIAPEVFSIKEVVIQDSKNKITTYKIEEDMIKHAKAILLDTWDIFKVATTSEVEKLIEKMNLEDPIQFLESYKKLIKEPIVKKIMKMIRERTIVVDETKTKINKLIHT